MKQPGDILVGVRGRQRDPQPARSHRHRGRADGGDPQSLLEQCRRRVECRLLAAENDGDDRARMSWLCEPGLRDPLDQRGEAARQCGAFGRPHDAQCGERCRGVGRRRCGREDVRAGPVHDEVDDLARRRHETAQRAQRLGHRADPNDRSPLRTVPALAPHPPALDSPGGGRRVGAEDGVGLIEDEEGVVTPAEGDEVVNGGDVPIHGEHGVGDDDGVMGVGRGGGEQLRQVSHVTVAVDGEG